MKRVLTVVAAVVILSLASGCPKSAVTPSIPPAPAAIAAKPVISFFTAEPTSTSSGQPVSLRWSVQGAERVVIDNGLGEVGLNGSRTVKPDNTTTFTLEATNGAGTTTALLTLSVAPQTTAALVGAGKGQSADTSAAAVVATQLQDIHFSYDQENIEETERAIADKDALVLKNLFAADPGVVVVIEGHCDERGSSEYNIALGDKRANFIKDLFVRSGLPKTNLDTVSFGKEQPACLDSTETCFMNNRRVHFSASR